MKKTVVFLAAALLLTLPASAQWHLMFSGGKDATRHFYKETRPDWDQPYTNTNGISFGLEIEYDINNWLSVVSGLNCIQTESTFTDNLGITVLTVNYKDVDLVVPVMARLSLKVPKTRVYGGLGAYCDYQKSVTVEGDEWTVSNFNQMLPKRDNDYVYGAAAEAGLTYSVFPRLAVGVGARWYIPLTTVVKDTSFKDNAKYNLSTVAFVSAAYSF